MPKSKLNPGGSKDNKLGKGAEIFNQPVVLEETQPLIDAQRAEKTIYMIRPAQRQALEEFVWKAKRHHREINNSMVVRCLLSIFATLDVRVEGVESEAMLQDRIAEALGSQRARVKRR